MPDPLPAPKYGLFVGLSTLDMVYQVAALPQPNQKVVALEDALTAGGPATNAAVTFAYLGDRPTLLSVLGRHSLIQPIQADLQAHGVVWHDLAPDLDLPPPISSILVTQGTGDRAVVSRNATKTQVAADALPSSIRTALIQRQIDIVLIDGHQMALSGAIATLARQHQIPVVLDGGSWKPGLDTVLPMVDYAICSANFRPQGCADEQEAIAYLQRHAIPHLAITHGGDPIFAFTENNRHTLPVPPIASVDTLGAGDIFHGAFCHFILRQPFLDALQDSACIAAHACQSFGTRHWMQAPLPPMPQRS